MTRQVVEAGSTIYAQNPAGVDRCLCDQVLADAKLGIGGIVDHPLEAQPREIEGFEAALQHQFAERPADRRRMHDAMAGKAA